MSRLELISHLEDKYCSEDNLPEFNKWFKVRNSQIQGRGTFARAAIRKGTCIGYYGGEKISSKEGDRRLNDQNYNGNFIITLSDKFDTDGNDMGNELRYTNHSCDPNLEFETGSLFRWFFATKKINLGEELTWSYRYLVNDDTLIHPCFCQSSNCYGFIVDPSKRDKLPAILERLGTRIKRYVNKHTEFNLKQCIPGNVAGQLLRSYYQDCLNENLSQQKNIFYHDPSVVKAIDGFFRTNF
jgi:hypothetical protein|tara:strand:+ start:1315 stop:2037 length:723 start_codon:yes stop_codon:yes gene_type:complete